MKCIKCGRNLGTQFCNVCGFDNKHIAKALNTADYYYNAGLEKAQMRDLSGAEILLKKALGYNKEHKNARNLLGLVYNEMGEGGSAYIQTDREIELLLAHRWEDAPHRFRIPAGVLVELYGDTLRSAPLGRDFRILVILPYATNTEWRDGAMRNTWLKR